MNTATIENHPGTPADEVLALREALWQVELPKHGNHQCPDCVRLFRAATSALLKLAQAIEED